MKIQATRSFTKKTSKDVMTAEARNTPVTAMTPSDDAELTQIVTANLKTLIDQHHMTQKELSEKVGYCEAAVSRYFRGLKFPPIDFLFKLKKLYDISIDDFISRKIIAQVKDEAPIEAERRRLEEIAELELYRKYCGNYLVYYLDTSNYKGRDFSSPAESLVYGVVNIHEVRTNLNKSDFECIAILGIDNRDKAAETKKALDMISSIEELSGFISEFRDKPGQNNIYTGSFEFGAKHAYISLKHGNIDRAFIILYRVETNKPVYSGGLGVINSGSKGREKMPTAQFMAFSRYPINLSEEEIHHELLLTCPTFDTDAETKELISMFKNTYLFTNRESELFTDYQKELMLKACMADSIRKIISRNMDRCAKASENDDSAWYHLVKSNREKY